MPTSHNYNLPINSTLDVSKFLVVIFGYSYARGNNLCCFYVHIWIHRLGGVGVEVLRDSGRAGFRWCAIIMIVHSSSCGATWPADFLRGSVSDADGENEEEPEGCYYNCEQRWQVYTAVFGYHRPLPSWRLLESLEPVQNSVVSKPDDAMASAIFGLDGSPHSSFWNPYCHQ